MFALCSLAWIISGAFSLPRLPSPPTFFLASSLRVAFAGYLLPRHRPPGAGGVRKGGGPGRRWWERPSVASENPPGVSFRAFSFLDAPPAQPRASQRLLRVAVTGGSVARAPRPPPPFSEGAPALSLRRIRPPPVPGCSRRRQVPQRPASPSSAPLAFPRIAQPKETAGNGASRSGLPGTGSGAGKFVGTGEPEPLLTRWEGYRRGCSPQPSLAFLEVWRLFSEP